ncbi:class III lanthionine synthetase LanKC [Bailinhaonella thermotolerans]|uniref:Protein kinase domain-containing protein n=1 Tax=Bailinhaonella thermotolerans TaxID=1070861 RepID=A0A3A4AWV9_9ACTN|nr:class III lanthionine synthetase LanKC [Bailinhaonella thermotolerans]RJL32777.1 hypothetical protein D5H75_15025 [Bailinhaonella thermotolerans]
MDDAFPQLLAFCQADPVFFERLDRLPDDATRFPAARRDLPAGWSSWEENLWVVLRPPGAALPEQGWKVHVSATDADAARVCDLVLDFCLARDLPVKFLRSRAAMRLLNSKYAARGSSGKLITIYPGDEERLAGVLPALADLLRGFAGPYILSDLRYEDSPVYVRYGAFRPMTFRNAAGETVYGVRAPDGRLVPDERGPVFRVPEWVTVPEVLRESVARLGTADDGEFPYEIERPLHFSNGGGVYLAREKGSGGYVVLLEARPHAGLDAAGVDAVTRLARERAILDRLDGLDCVPRVLGHTVVWEHHFLVEEYIEGKTLMEEVFDRYPLVGPESSAEETAAYVRWATGVLAKVDHALMAVHARGVRFNDLHPGNVIVRPDGRVALIDFEIACDLDDPDSPGLGAPGFIAPGGLSGRAADEYVMNCLRQWVFLPISPLQERDPAKLASLTEVIAEHFPVPPGFGARLVRRFAAARGPLGEDTAGGLFRGGEADWPRIRDSLVAGILASATPGRDDRLYPGDPGQFPTGGISVATGAAGVLWALREAGADIPEEHVDWLAAAARRAADPRPGLLDGLHGAAAALDALGRRDDALDLFDRARKQHADLAAPGIHGGLAGAGLSLLHFAGVTGDESLRAEALDIGARLAPHAEDPDLAPSRVGLEHGLTGVAHYFLRLHAETGEDRFLGLARTALLREIDRGRRLPDGTFQLLEDNRYLSYLGTGSAGLALVLARYLALRDEPGFAEVVDGARRACRAPFIRHPVLLMGRAGAIAALALLGRAEDRDTVRDHVRRLSWHALSYRGHLAFPGNQLLRLSMDLATGSAGILAALNVVSDPGASIIPLLDLRPDAGGEKERR